MATVEHTLRVVVQKHGGLTGEGTLEILIGTEHLPVSLFAKRYNNATKDSAATSWQPASFGWCWVCVCSDVWNVWRTFSRWNFSKNLLFTFSVIMAFRSLVRASSSFSSFPFAAHTMLEKRNTLVLWSSVASSVAISWCDRRILATVDVADHVYNTSCPRRIVCMTVKTDPVTCALFRLHAYFMSEAEKLASKCVSTTTWNYHSFISTERASDERRMRKPKAIKQIIVRKNRT